MREENVHMDQSDLFKTIQSYGKTAHPFHMPGHKRNTELLGIDLPYDVDITEIAGFDNLHAPEKDGILSALRSRGASLYRAKYAFPLVNGSTCGILAAIRALAEPNRDILVARNCHKSVYHAVELTGQRHVSLLPPIDEESGIYGSIRPSDVETALTKNPKIGTVVIVSPTYEGVLSDVKTIADITHTHGARLIVDAAHGAHLGFTEDLPPFPSEADVVITSLHKTLPALTQTALALVYSDDESLESRIARELSVFESSSPSYVLLSSIDRCISLLEEKKDELFSHYEELIKRFRSDCSDLKHLTLLSGGRIHHPDFFDYDEGKLLILSRAESLTGIALADRLRNEFSVECEMAYADYVLCMTSICDREESFATLSRALHAIDTSLESDALCTRRLPFVQASLPEVKMTLKEAIALPPAPLTAGEVARDYAWVYPPGVPLVVPGEEVTKEALSLLKVLESSGLSVKIGR